jgi:hypothetical protein
MGTPLLCSLCFHDQGLRLDGARLGHLADLACPQCGHSGGAALDRDALLQLVHRFFVRGTWHRLEYGGAPAVQFNEHMYGQDEFNASEWLRDDVSLLCDTLKIGFFPYGPRMWMVGDVEPLKRLQDPAERDPELRRIVDKYPARILGHDEIFYRLRVGPTYPTDPAEYDAPPIAVAGRGRLDSPGRPVLYGSQDLEVCIHECRVSAEDVSFVATLRAVRALRLLDLTTLLAEDLVTEFESLDMACHMLFLAGAHSYEICRAIAEAASAAGFDGLVYPSYFSLVRTGAMPFETAYGLSIRKIPSLQQHAQSQTIPNLALFGRPIASGLVAVACINRVVLQRVAYDVHFGPVLH